MMCSDCDNDWRLGYYAGANQCFIDGLKSSDTYDVYIWKYIVPHSKFNPMDLNANKERSIIKNNY